jgi:D-alanine-D-alanine ligase-like ATP-grasp enzyme
LFDERLSKVYVCEVNAIPGSLAYYFFKKNFIVRNDLVEKLIKIAEKNHNKCMINSEFMVDLLDKK